MRRGVTTADLKVWGKMPLSSDLLMMDAITGASNVSSFFTKDVGSGSRSQLLLGADVISFVTCSMLTGSKMVSELLTGGG